MEFVQANILLIAIAVVSGVMLFVPSFRRSGGDNVDPTAATLLINREDALVIDVREPAEFVAGHIPQARNIPLSKFAERVGELDQFKERPVIVNCRSGHRSANACGQLKKHGFTRIYNLDGGVGAWEQAGLPLSRRGGK